MKRVLTLLAAIGLFSPLYGAGTQNALTVSSGTFSSVDMYSNADGSNRQAIVIGDFTSSDTVRVDQITGMRVSLSTSPLTTSGAVMVVSTATTVTNTGFNVNNTPSVSQSGTWTVQPGNTANTTAWKVDGSAVTQPVSGTFWQATQPISGSVTVLPGAQNLVVTSTATLPVSLAANQSVNVAQINGVTPLMGAGNTGTGSHRVTLATDNAAIATWGQGATGSAVPSGAVYRGGIAKTALPTAASDGNLTGTLLDKFGRTVTISDCPRDLILSTGAVLTSNTNEYVLLSSGTAGVFNDAVAIVATNSSATASLLTLRTNGNATTSTLHFYIPAGDTRGISLPHIWPQGTAAANWTVQSSASVASIYVDMIYCQNK